MIAVMVAAMLAIVALASAVWLVSPAFREWCERPKHALLARDRAFTAAGAAPAAARDDPTADAAASADDTA